MIEIINIERANYWDEIVTGFPNHDIYYLSGYLQAFKAHGDGDPILFWYKDSDCQAVCAMFKRDVSTHPFFSNYIEKTTFFDIITPYGYGGFIFKGNPTPLSLKNFIGEYNQFLISNKIISSFTRYHPILQNVGLMRTILPVIDLGSTISLSLKSEGEIWSKMSSKNRNMIRKAQKSGVSIQYGNERELLHRFKEIYDATMTKDNAEQYYYFDESFYDSINNDLKSNYQVFYAKYNELVIAMSIFIYANNNMHYHLSGSDSSFRHLAPTNLLIYEAARWGCRQGFNSLHLGGGLGSGEDNLFKFKKAFNPTSANQFSIGKQIVDEEKYEFLKELRKNNDPDFNSESHFFPVYRA